ncbi:MAG: glutamate--tRNA ligase [Alphaproteobacteria bacterium]
MKIITRFAPSPTGDLHIGGARTALFNYLFARHHGGEFKLRIEDTDLARSTEAAKNAIIDGLSWLGVCWDGDIVYQSIRAARHREVAEELLRLGQAYYCYETPEELAEKRAAAEAIGVVYRYDRKWRDSKITPPAGVKPAIRIKAPLAGEVIVRDLVQGEVRVASETLDDFIILRADGTPTYMLAVVVDDHDMSITHIIRGDDHLNNASRQMVIYEAMGWDVPAFAHIPLIHGPDGAKLSKRHGATAIGEYANMGYLPEAMRNYLLRLGWSHGDDEIISDAEAIAWFTLDHVGQSPARLDFAKLGHVNAHYLKLRSDADLAGMVAPVLPTKNTPPDLLIKVMPLLKSRAQTIIELAEAAKLFAERPANYDEKAQAVLVKGKANFALLIPALQSLAEPWVAESVKAAIHEVATSSGKKLGELMPPLRASLFGTMSGPDIPDAMAVLGKAEVLARLEAVIR